MKNFSELFAKEKILIWQDNLFSRAKEYLRAKKTEFELLLVSVVILIFLIRLPYLNVFIGMQLVYFAITVLFIWLFKIEAKKLLYLILCLFFLAFLATVIGREETAEHLGNQIYFLLWLVVIMQVKQLWKEK